MDDKAPEGQFMGFSMTFLMVFIALVALPGGSALAATSGADFDWKTATPEERQKQKEAFRKSCEDLRAGNILLPSEYLKKRGVADPSEPCPNFDNSNVSSVQCKQIVDELEVTMQSWLKVHQEACRLADIRAESCSAGNCNDEVKQKFKEAIMQNKAERTKVIELIKKLDTYRVDMANGLDDAAIIAKDTIKEPTPGEQYINHTKGEIANFADKVEKGLVNSSDISGTKDERIKEPMRVAEMLQTIQKQMISRDKDLQQKSADLGSGAATNETIQKKGVSQENNKIVSNTKPSSFSGNTDPAASKLLENAEPSAKPASAGSMPSMPGGGGGGSGGGSQAPGSGSVIGNDYRIPQDGGTYTNNYTPSFSPSSDSDSSSKAASSSKTGGVVDISPDAALAAESAEKTALLAGGNSTGSSRRSLRDALRAKLAGGGESTGGGTTSASVGGSASGGSGGGSQSSKKEMRLAALFDSPQSGEILSNAGGDSFGGSESFELAGSETDAFIQNMVGDLSEEFDGARDLASEGEVNGADIMAEDTASLFTRTRSTHNRYVKKGLLLTRARAGS